MKKINATETLNLISKQYADINDIKLLAQCGGNKAYEIKNKITEELKDWLLPKGSVPMSKLVEYLKIDIKYLRKVERSEIK